MTSEFSSPKPGRGLPEPALARILFRNADAKPDAVAVRRRESDGSWSSRTHAEYLTEVCEVAKGLIARGVQPGDRVALMSRTRYEWSLVGWAIWTAGAVCVPIYETSSSDQCDWVLSDSGARLAIAETAELRDRIAESDWDGEVLTLEDGLVDELRRSGVDVPNDRIDETSSAATADDLATLIYTSGTTGRPKGCEIPHGGFGGVVAAVDERLSVAFHEDASTLIFLPLAHVFARIVEITCFHKGAVVQHEGDTSVLVDRLAEVRPTFLVSVPRVLEKVYNAAAGKAEAKGGATAKVFRAATATAVTYSKATEDGGKAGPLLTARHALFAKLVYSKLHAALGGRCEYVISGGGPLGDRLGHFFRGAGFELLEGYGLTESSGVLSVNPPFKSRIGTVGIPIPGVTLRIHEEDGEILAKADSLFHGYWKNEQANADSWTDGWFHTGDVGTLDDDGYLRITGRKKDLIVTAGGKNVSPSQLEDLLASHPLVSQAMVVGDNRSYVAALVTIDPETFEDWKSRHGKKGELKDLLQDGDLVGEVQDAVDRANRSVSRAESIRKFRILADEFSIESGELTPTLKLKRNVVHENREDEIEALYEK